MIALVGDNLDYVMELVFLVQVFRFDGVPLVAAIMITFYFNFLVIVEVMVFLSMRADESFVLDLNGEMLNSFLVIICEPGTLILWILKNLSSYTEEDSCPNLL